MQDHSFAAHLCALIDLQRTAYETDGFPSAAVRRDRLARLEALLVDHRTEIEERVAHDFGHRSHDETRFELMGALSSLRAAAAHLEDWMTPIRHEPLAPGAEAQVEWTPLGVVGVIGPWNFPIMPIVGPLAGILAAGNRAIIKPSEHLPATSDLLACLVAKRFSPAELAVVSGGAEEGAVFAAACFDHLIFTGSANAARSVLRAAAENLTPVTLELGGKSPVIVTDDFDLGEAAARIMAVKTRNAGQICLAPDYVLVPQGRELAFANACRSAVESMFPGGAASDDYTAIISERHRARLVALVSDARAQGAEVVELMETPIADDRRIVVPTLLLDVSPGMTALSEEIFGPILPIIGYDDLDHALAAIRSGPKPLALYLFGRDSGTARRVLAGTSSGGVTINDVMTHVFVESMPFGGVGQSGMGAYRGQAGFETFSHRRAVYRQSEQQDVAALIRAPYGAEFRGFLEAASTRQLSLTI